VLFPDGSLDLVAGVYRGNPVSDFYNRRIAELVSEAVAGQPGARVLEIGAGTGATTEAVLDELRGRGLALAEYRYTDLSQSFLRHGDERYGGAHPYFATARFDVEQRPEQQGLAAGAYDVVVASNVLHATASIARTLDHAKALLKRGGLLILNEIGRVQPFATLTFGLLDGWWRFSDAPLRLPGSPGLSAQSWERALDAAGFRRVVFACPEAHELGQQVIAAESDGVYIAPRAMAQKTAAEPQPADRPGLATAGPRTSRLATATSSAAPRRLSACAWPRPSASRPSASSAAPSSKSTASTPSSSSRSRGIWKRPSARCRARCCSSAALWKR
jgi:polyketide synthase PksR